MKIRATVMFFAALTCIAGSVGSADELGVRISLPICDQRSAPSNFVMLEAQGPSDTSWSAFDGFDRPRSCTSANDCFMYSEYPSISTSNWVVDGLDWGDDNKIFGVHHEECVPPWWLFPQGIKMAVVSPYFNSWEHPSDGPALAHVHGFINNVGPSNVYGQIIFVMKHNTTPLTLAIQVQEGSSWVDVSTTSLSSCDYANGGSCQETIAEVSASVSGNSDVRLELRLAPDKHANDYLGQVLYIYEATLFGAECFPDATNPGMCL